jgi:hypothetical protein
MALTIKELNNVQATIKNWNTMGIKAAFHTEIIGYCLRDYYIVVDGTKYTEDEFKSLYPYAVNPSQ